MSKTRTITPNPPADFTPELGSYKTLQPFRYWCQKVLPLVYDDSLSYYELLCKVVDYLNKTMEDVEILHGDVTNLHTAYEELQAYVNDYFSTLDVQEEINNKLNQMASDGTLTDIITPIISEYQMPQIVNTVEEMANIKKLYILSTDGHLYYHNGSNFVDSGLTYTQANNSVISSGIIVNSDNYNDYNNADNFKQNLIYAISSTVTKEMVANLPVYGKTAIILNYGYLGQDNESGFIQQYVNIDGQVFMREKGSSDYGDWCSPLISSGDYLPAGYVTANALPPNQIFAIPKQLNESTFSGLPLYGVGGIIYTLTNTFSSGVGAQTVIYSNGLTFTRWKSSSGYGSWTNSLESSGNLPGGYTNADELPYNQIFGFSSSLNEGQFSGLPIYGSTGIVYTLSNINGTDGVKVQVAVYANGTEYRRFYTSSGWTMWSNDLMPSGLNVPSGYSNADALPANQIFAIPKQISESTFPGLPLYGVGGIIYTLTNTFSSGVGAQTVIYSNGLTFTRWKSSSGYGSWTNSLESSGNLPGGYTNADELPYNQIFGFSSSLNEGQFSGLPIYGSTGIIYTLSNIGGTGGVKVQVAVYANGAEYRRFATSAGYGSWMNFDNVPVNFVNTCVDKPITINSDTKIYLFGDSLTTTTHGGFTWLSLIISKFGCTGKSYGVGSAVFDNTDENSIIAQINGVSDWSDVDIIIVAAGVNDCRLNSDVNNFKNSVLETITTLKQKAPNAKLVYITPLRYNASTLDNLNSYAGAICNLAVSNGCSVINGFDFPIQTYDTEWVTELTDNDGLHPNANGKHVYAQSVLNALL